MSHCSTYCVIDVPGHEFPQTFDIISTANVSIQPPSQVTFFQSSTFLMVGQIPIQFGKWTFRLNLKTHTCIYIFLLVVFIAVQSSLEWVCTIWACLWNLDFSLVAPRSHPTLRFLPVPVAQCAWVAPRMLTCLSKAPCWRLNSLSR